MNCKSNIIKKSYQILLLVFVSTVLGQTDIKLYDYILLHGINSEASVWNGTAVKSLIENDLKMNNLDLVGYGDIDDQHISTIAQSIHDNITGQTGDETIVIAHSMGGLVTRSFIEQYTRGELSTLVTLGTPHDGANISTAAGEDKANELIARLTWAAAYDIAYILDQSTELWFFEDLWWIFSNEGVLSEFVWEVYAALFDYIASEFFGTADYDSGEDLSPGSTFLTNLNANTVYEEIVDRFSIIGDEDWPELYRYLSSLLFDSDDALNNYIDILITATEIAAVYSFDWAEYYLEGYIYYYWEYEFWYWEWWNTGDPWYADYCLDWMDYYWYMQEIYWNNFCFADFWFQIMVLDHNEYTDIPTEYRDEVLLSDYSDGIVTTTSQAWSVIATENQFTAVGANHADEKDNEQVIQRLEYIAELQSLYQGQGYNENHFVLGDIDGDMELTMLDVVIMVNYILETIELTPYQELVADVNEDGDVDILDNVALVALIMGSPRNNTDSDDYLNIDATATVSIGQVNGLARDGESFTIIIDSEIPVGGFQLDLNYDPNLSDGFIIEATDVTQDFEIRYNAISDSTTRVVVYATDLSVIPTGLQEVLYVQPEGLLRSNMIQSVNIQNAILASIVGNSIAINNGSDIPAEFSLFPAYPNPFNPETTIKFDLPAGCNLSLKIYGVMGREVAELVNENQMMQAGYHSVVWNASGYASGVYFVKLITPEYSETQKLMLLK